MTLVSTPQQMPKSAATMLLSTDGLIRAHSSEDFETACVIDESLVLHPFAFRVHAHARGKVVSGWKVTTDDNGENIWKLIGKRDPMDPQVSVANSCVTGVCRCSTRWPTSR